jgi:hypothetical protein
MERQQTDAKAGAGIDLVARSKYYGFHSANMFFFQFSKSYFIF